MAASTVEARNRNAADSIIYQCYSRRRMPRKPAVWRRRADRRLRMVQFRQAHGPKITPPGEVHLAVRSMTPLRRSEVDAGPDREFAGAVAARQA